MDLIFVRLTYMHGIKCIKNHQNAVTSIDVFLLPYFHLHVSAGDQGHLQGEISVARIQCDQICDYSTILKYTCLSNLTHLVSLFL